MTGSRSSEAHFKHSDLCSHAFCSYKLAENIDAQLKRMAQDLKDITEHLNTSRGPADTSDPVNPSFIVCVLMRDKGCLNSSNSCGCSAACSFDLGRVF